MLRSHGLWLLLAASVVTVGAALALGPHGVLSAPWTTNETEREIVRHVRLPRVVLGFVAGAALAIAGMAFQALFRNALATPYTLGVSAGASFGAALYVKAGLTASIAGIPGYAIAALCGALLTIALVYGMGGAAVGFSPATLLLGGVAVSFLFTSLILTIQYLGDVTTSFRIGRWLLGGLEIVGFAPLLQLLPFVGIGLAVLLAIPRELDLLVVGEESAAARGVSVDVTRRLVFLASSLMVGGVVAVCGPIGFVGVIVPHVGRLLLGPRHRTLGPFCLLAGGAFLVICDTVGRIVVAPVEIPVGIITALIGVPFFLALLVQGHLRLRRAHGGL